MTDAKTKVVTVRMPESLHAELMGQSHDIGVSANWLCVQAIREFLGHGDVVAEWGRKFEAAAIRPAGEA